VLAIPSEHRENPLLQLRGNAGTHDMPLLMHTMQALQSRFNCSNTSTFVQIPRYDKSLRSGKGDRAPTADWLSIPSAEPVDIVLVEGWMLGFSPVPSSALLEGTYYTHANIQQINALLKQYETFHQMFDGWLVVALEDINIVYEWRLEAEKRMIRAGKPGMTDAYVD
jgi:D-glycerate 3-kinase